MNLQQPCQKSKINDIIIYLLSWQGCCKFILHYVTINSMTDLYKHYDQLDYHFYIVLGSKSLLTY